jgi:D-arabinono-1,4-lactone oxidase
MKQSEIIAKGIDGYYHPKNEDEVIALVKYAASNKLKIRARGASHSTAHSIFTDPIDGKPENRTLIRTPPSGPDLNLAMDRLAALDWTDEAHGIVEAEAGIHLGWDPYDAIGVASLDSSLLHQLFQKGWGINDLGGITHQTVSGFTATGSAGGSMKYDLDNVLAFRIVDGRGIAAWIERGDPIFDAVAVSMGLLGIVTKIRLRLNRTFIVDGEEVTTPVAQPECPIDLFGPGDSAKPSMRRFLEETDYCRVMWWPQEKAQRVVIWQANRNDQPSVFEPVPYQELTPDLGGWAEQLFGAIVYLLLGNPGFAVIPKLFGAYARFVRCVASMWKGGVAAWAAAAAVAAIIAILLAIPTLIFILLPGVLRALFPTALNVLQPMSNGKPTLFTDYYWRSLPMDNTADDILLGTEFCEMWMPIQYTQQCMNLLKDMFQEKGVSATGYFALEIYATKATSAWLSPGYSGDDDEFKDGVVRFDAYWYRGNQGEPNVKGGFYQQYWDLFVDAGIPLRFHWGKFIPAFDLPHWAAHYRKNLPKLDEFMKVRQERDPDGIFFTRYWRERLTGEA